MSPLDELLTAWELTPDGAGGTGPRTGPRSTVVPVRTPAGAPAVLKVALGADAAGRTERARHALQRWHGRGAVRLLRADPHRAALLLERVPAPVEDLDDAWDVEACEVVAGLYPLLHVTAPPTVPLLSERAAAWARGLGALPRSAPLPPRLVAQAASLAASFAADPATDGVLLHGDLHFGHVVAADREAWLALSPDPVSGDPHAEPAPMLWSRWDELVGPGAVGSLRDGLRRRFHTLVDAAGLDEDRARDWVVTQALARALARLGDPSAVPDGPPDAELLTRCVALAKAVQG